MKKREFIAVLALGVLAAAAGASHAQQAGKTYRIGMVEPVSAELNAAYLAAFRLALRDLGYVEERIWSWSIDRLMAMRAGSPRWSPK